MPSGVDGDLQLTQVAEKVGEVGRVMLTAVLGVRAYRLDKSGEQLRVLDPKFSVQGGGRALLPGGDFERTDDARDCERDALQAFGTGEVGADIGAAATKAGAGIPPH